MKTSLNWFIPALANSSVASPAGISDDEGTTRCPRPAKYSRKVERISRVVGLVAMRLVSPVLAQGTVHQVQAESAREQIPYHFPPLLRKPPPEAVLRRHLGERGRERGGFALPGGKLGERRVGRALRHLPPLERGDHGAPAAPRPELRPADAAGEGDLVEQAGTLEPRELGGHRRRLAPPARELIGDLGVRQRSPREHRECRFVERLRARRSRVVSRTISGAHAGILRRHRPGVSLLPNSNGLLPTNASAPGLPSSVLSISSRETSDVDWIPWMRSLNSSGLEARRIASSSVIRPDLYRLYRDWSNVCIPYCEVPAAIASRISLVFSFCSMHSRM